MEKYWQRCIYQYMCCDPEEHYFLLVRFALLPEFLRLCLILICSSFGCFFFRPSPP